MSEEKQARRETQVAVELNNLRDVLATLEKGMASARERLIPVLRDTPDGNKEEPEKEMVLVPLAREIKNVADRVCALNIEVNGMLGKLEL